MGPSCPRQHSEAGQAAASTYSPMGALLTQAGAHSVLEKPAACHHGQVLSLAASVSICRLERPPHPKSLPQTWGGAGKRGQ
jgi:hypothetical protein